MQVILFFFLSECVCVCIRAPVCVSGADCEHIPEDEAPKPVPWGNLHFEGRSKKDQSS